MDGARGRYEIPFGAIERPLDLPDPPPSQPMLTDIVFTDSDHMVLALRDRQAQPVPLPELSPEDVPR